MKKKIFIAGAVREYDSDAPKQFETEIEEYIKQNLVNAECADAVKVLTNELSPDELRVEFGFTTGDQLSAGTISRQLYQCFFGDCKNFVAKHSLWFPMGFGPSYPINWRVPIEQIKEYHKKNTTFYGGSRYKDMDLNETSNGLVINFRF